MLTSTRPVHIIENAKTSRPSVCNAEEVCLVHRAVAARVSDRCSKRRWSMTARRRASHRSSCGWMRQRRRSSTARALADTDFDTEYLDYILAVGVVDSLDAAIAHVLAHSTHHSDAIVTEDAASAERFIDGTDSAATSTSTPPPALPTAGEFGLGCEMGISTQKLHARGPMGLDELSTYKYIIRGDGQIR